MLGEKLNPLFLDASNFCVAESAGRVVACAQVRGIDAGAAELASVVVERRFRRRGLGTLLIGAALDAAARRGVDTRDVYLLTLTRTSRVYEQCGFRPIAFEDAPLTMRLEAAAGKLVVRFLGAGELCAMRFADDGRAAGAVGAGTAAYRGKN